MADLITLILPHGSDSTSEPLPALERLLSRAELRSCDSSQWEAQFIDAAKVEAGQVPVAPYCCLAEGGMPGDDYWLCASPAHLVADQDKAYLAAYGDALAVSKDEADALVSEFNDLFASDGWQLLALSPSRWYLRLPESLRINTTPPQQALGFDIRPLLPQGEQAMAVHAALAEIEMLFYGSKVNNRRREQELPLINGLWLWGGGVLPRETIVHWHSMQGNSPWLHGVALHAGCPWQEVGTSALPLVNNPGDHLVVFDSGLHHLSQLEQAWFKPLMQALSSGSVQRLELYLTATSTLYRLERRYLRRWWRRRRSWARHAAIPS